MPWRLIGFIAIFAVFLAFIAFNLGNTCDISFGFKSFPAVPVYLTVFMSFMLGMFTAIPFVLSLSLKKKGQQRRKKVTKDETAELVPDGPSDLKEKDSPYGID